MELLKVYEDASDCVCGRHVFLGEIGWEGNSWQALNKVLLLKLVDAKSKYQRVGKVMLAARFMFGSYYRYMNSVSVSPVAQLNWLGLFEVHGFRDCCRRGKTRAGVGRTSFPFFGWPKETAAGEHGRSASAGAEQRSAGVGVLSGFLFLGWPKDAAGLALCSGGSAGGGSGGKVSAWSATWILRRLAGPLCDSWHVWHVHSGRSLA